jgi:hypothetical protein
MLNRIQSREPFYDHHKWEEERARDVQYLKNIQSREVMHLSDRFKSLPPIRYYTAPPHSAPAQGQQQEEEHYDGEATQGGDEETPADSREGEEAPAEA